MTATATMKTKDITKEARPIEVTEPIIDQTPVPKKLPADSLVVYPETQRPAPTRESVKKITNNFNWSRMGAIHVNVRADGTYHVMDGQRRLAALRALKLSDRKVLCLVYQGLTVAQEADMFRWLNNTRVCGSFDSFDKGVMAGDLVCIGITKVCHKYGWKVARASSGNSASCVMAMQKLWKIDSTGGILTQTIRVLTAAWGHDKNTMAGNLVEGMGKFLSDNEVEEDKLVDKLRSRFATPVSVIMQARARTQSETGTLASNLAVIVSRCYESRKKSA